MGGHDEPGQAQPPFVPPGVITPLPVSIPGAVSADTIQKTQEAQRHGSESVATAQRLDHSLSDRGAGTDPDFVRTDERFQSMTHEQILQSVHRMDVAGIHDARKTWLEVHSELENLSTFHLMRMNGIVDHGLWRGASGAAAQAASQRLARAADQVGEVFGSVSQRLDVVGWTAEAVRLAVPPVPGGSAQASPNPDDPAQSILPGVINPDYAQQLDTQRQAARNAAVHAMEILYKPGYPPAGSAVPAYTTVPQIGDASPGDGKAGFGGAESASQTGGFDSADAQTQQQPAGAAGDAMGAHGNPHGAGNPASGMGSGGRGGSDRLGGTATTPTGLGSSGFGGPGAHGWGGGGGYSGGNGMPGHGGGYGGGRGGATPGSPTPENAGRAAAAGGNSPGAAAGPMAPGLPGKRSDEQREHRSPAYLRRVEPDWTAGIPEGLGVIGEDPSAAKPQPSDELKSEPAQGFSGAGIGVSGLFAEYGWRPEAVSVAAGGVAGPGDSRARDR